MTIVAEMAARGCSYNQILERVPISLSQLKADLRRVRKQWQEQQLSSIDQVVARELAKLDHIEQQAWGEWDSSKARKTGGDTDYLRVILLCMERRAKLYGLEKPAETHNHLHVTTDAGQLVMSNPQLREHEKQFWIDQANQDSNSIASGTGDSANSDVK